MKYKEERAIGIKKKIKEVYEALPKLNCGLCGYSNCGQFARAVAEGKAPCYGCVSGGPEVAAKVCGIIGVKAPASDYRYAIYQPALAQRSGSPPSPASLRKEVGGLAQKVDDILARIEELANN